MSRSPWSAAPQPARRSAPSRPTASLGRSGSLARISRSSAAAVRPGQRIGVAAGEELVEEHAQRIDVRGRGQRQPLDLLRARIGRRQQPHLRPRRQRKLLGIEELRDPEVEQLGDPVRRHQQVARLQVAVHHQALVGVLDGAAGGDEEIEPLAQRRPPAGAPQVDRLALDALHDEVRAGRPRCCRRRGAGRCWDGRAAPGSAAPGAGGPRSPRCRAPAARASGRPACGTARRARRGRPCPARRARSRPAGGRDRCAPGSPSASPPRRREDDAAGHGALDPVLVALRREQRLDLPRAAPHPLRRPPPGRRTSRRRSVPGPHERAPRSGASARPSRLRSRSFRVGQAWHKLR